MRTIQGLPIRCHSASLTTLLGVQDIHTLVQQRQLNFIVSVANLDPVALPRKLLCTRSASSTAKSITRQYQVLTNLIFQASLLYSLNPPSAHPGRLLLRNTWASLHTSHSLKNVTIAMLANVPSSLTTQPPIGRSPLGTLSLLV